MVVNDGSGSEYDTIFNQLKLQIPVLTHTSNKGKGSAIKTGFTFIRNIFQVPYVVVCFDDDGQHTIEDVNRVCVNAEKYPHALILGIRCFQGEVPQRSRIGNIITRGVYYAISKQYISDTQTGLRVSVIV